MIGFPGVGEGFGDFRIDAELGRGGMGVVFRATQLSLNRPVALKVLDPRLASDAEFTRRFTHEATILAGMSSPHVVQVYGHGQVGDCLYLAMQFVSGGDLSQYLGRSGPLPVPLALDLTSQTLAALVDAHARGVVHRDVKPSNILLTTSGDRLFAYLCDFGIAQSGDGQLTRTGTVVGSWAFMAPERHEGAPATAQSDVYAAGCVLWCLLSGRNPYQGTDVQVAIGHMSGPVPQLQGTDPLSTGLNLLLARSMAKSPAGRYPSAAAFLQAIHDVAVVPTGPVPAVTGPVGTALDDRTRLRPTSAPTLGGPQIAGGAPGHPPTADQPSVASPHTRLRPAPPPTKPPTAEGGSAGSRHAKPLLIGGIAVGATALVAVAALLMGTKGSSEIAASSTETTGSPTSSPTSAATAMAVGYVCWDGTPVEDLSGCSAPHGPDGIHYLYPSLVADIKDCSKVETSFDTKVSYECAYRGKGLIRYTYWGSSAESFEHYRNSYADVTPSDLVLSGETIGQLYVRNSLVRGRYRRTGVWFNGRFSFSVEAPTKALEAKLSAKVRLRAPSDVLGYPEDAQPATAKPNLP